MSEITCEKCIHAIIFTNPLRIYCKKFNTCIRIREDAMLLPCGRFYHYKDELNRLRFPKKIFRDLKLEEGDRSALRFFRSPEESRNER